MMAAEKATYLWRQLCLIIGQQVVVEFRAVKLALERPGRGGVGLGDVAVVAGGWRGPSTTNRLGRLLAGAVNRRLLRETLVRQEVGLDSVLTGWRLGFGTARGIKLRT